MDRGQNMHYFGRTCMRDLYTVYTSLDSNTCVNLRFDTDLIVNNWATKEFNKNDVDINIPKDLSLLIAKFICGDLHGFIFWILSSLKNLVSQT